MSDHVDLLNGWDNGIWLYVTAESVALLTHNSSRIGTTEQKDDRVGLFRSPFSISARMKQNEQIKILIMVGPLSANVIVDSVQAKEGAASPAV